MVGFTLAEVLITLVVLGIIAAVTIPTLRNSLDDKKYKVPLKKVYSVLSEALDQTFYFSDLDENIWKNAPRMKKLTEHLGISKICCPDGKKLGDDECYWGVGKYYNDCFEQPKWIDGSICNTDAVDDFSRSSFVLKDGTAVTIKFQYQRQLVAFYGIDSNFRNGFGSDGSVFLQIFVDVNGKTGPNTVGKDVHIFVYTKSHGLIPAGADANSNNTLIDDCNGSNGIRMGCTSNYLYDEE